jgi:hypothetical protein
MRIVVLALAMLALTAKVQAQPQEWADKLFGKDNTTHNFGSVARGAVLSHRFPMTNIYAVDLTITNIRVSCGCVTATPSVQALKPKETATLDVTMDARRFTGPKTVYVYVSVGPQYTSTATLTLTANSRGDIVFNPGQINFGVVASGTTPAQTIDIEYAGNLDWKISGVADHSAPLETKLEQLYREAGPVIKVGYRLTAKLKANAPAGTHHWELLLQTTDPASPTVAVLAEATIQAPLSVVGEGKKTFPPTTVGQAVEMKIVLRGSKPFHVLEVQNLGDGVSVPLPTTAGPQQIVTLRWQPTKAGELKRELRFKTDLDGGAMATVSIEGTAVP